jgi:serine/threonine protein kinase
VAAFVRALEPVCHVLAALHERGLAHRALTPDTILILRGGKGSRLRDVGLASWPAEPGEGPATYGAPEQEHPLRYPKGLMPRVDIYQLASIVYHVVTGSPPSRIGEPLPSTAWTSDLPRSFDEALRRNLVDDPARRDGDIRRMQRTLVAALRQPNLDGTR